MWCDPCAPGKMCMSARQPRDVRKPFTSKFGLAYFLLQWKLVLSLPGNIFSSGICPKVQFVNSLLVYQRNWNEPSKQKCDPTPSIVLLLFFFSSAVKQMRTVKSTWRDCWTSGRRGVSTEATSFSSSNWQSKTQTAPDLQVNQLLHLFCLCHLSVDVLSTVFITA